MMTKKTAEPNIGVYVETLANMTLRDWFAGQAMAAYIASPRTATEATERADLCAQWAYIQADEMLKQRKQ